MRVDADRRIDGMAALGAHKMSMLQDLERGRSMEIEPLVGVIAELGRLLDVPTPTTDIVLALIRQRARSGPCNEPRGTPTAAPRALEATTARAATSAGDRRVERRWSSPSETRSAGIDWRPPPKLELQPLNTNVSLREQAYAALKQAIMDADIYAHREEIRLDERQLSQALGVSRTPIREAMSLLEQEGFLRTVPRRGVFIVRKTKKQIIEMIEMWAALESMAARLATAERVGRGHRVAAAHVRRVPELGARRAHRRVLRTPTSLSTRRSSVCRARTSWARRSRICSSTFARFAA